MTPLPKGSKKVQLQYRRLLAAGFSSPVAAAFAKQGRKFLKKTPAEPDPEE